MGIKNVRLTTAIFVERAVSFHGLRYDYSNVVYVNAKTNVEIICKEHGSFMQRASHHTSGSGCPDCGNIQSGIVKRLSIDKFIKLANALHGDKYDYSLVDYKTNRTKVKIICKSHGVFLQEPDSHLSGRGCNLCGYNTSQSKNTSTLEFVLDRFREAHGDKYDYSNMQYVNSTAKVEIICKTHGTFWQVPNAHKAGKGCQACSSTRNGRMKRLSVDDFIKKANVIHNNKYDYSQVDYVTNSVNVKIICPEHGGFFANPANHMRYSGCPKCCSTFSKQENKIADFIESLGFEVIRNDRTQIAPLELDIYIPELSLAIEYNGIFWHSEAHKEKKYHQKKYLKCKDQGISLFQIREDLWITKRQIIESMIIYKLGLANRIFARKCKVIPLEFREARSFYQEHHLQGAGMCHSKQMHVGLEFNGQLVMALSADCKKRYITRVCSHKGLAIVGGARRLLARLPSGKWMTYSSNDLGGSMSHYEGVTSTAQTEPSYFWFKGMEVVQRQKVQKHKLPKLFPDYDGSTEITWMQSQGYLRYFNAGNTKLEIEL